MAELLDWKLEADGHIELLTLGGYETGSAGELSLLRLEYFQTEAAMNARDASVLQLRMLPAHARELANALIQSAEAAENAEAINAPFA